jgi:hypothetical protein
MKLLKKCIITGILLMSFILLPFKVYTQKLDNSSELIKLYREYRIIQLKKTTWVDTIDNWTGKFHSIMIHIGDTLGKPVYTKKDIIQLIGKPDEIVSRKTMKETAELYYVINNKPISEIKGNEEYLIYKWRGYRDFLYFHIMCNKVKCSEFYYSWE